MLAERFVALGYVDDALYASNRAASLTRRGYGPRRVADSLRAAGIGAEDAAPAQSAAKEGAWDAALAFARRKRIGPFAAAPTDRAAREKAFAALIRAGHDMNIARRIVRANPGDVPEPDEG
jgi:regulatory protein